MLFLAKMMGHGNYFVEWKEQFVSQERGNRVVHYFLKDSAGESILAVVGTERSVRHMFYVVADEFLQAHGKENSVHSGFKWRSRREVVDWLTSMLSKQHSPGDHSGLSWFFRSYLLFLLDIWIHCEFLFEFAKVYTFRSLSAFVSICIFSFVENYLVAEHISCDT